MPMNTLKAKRCSLLMVQYKRSKDTECRNHIYKLSRTTIIKCLKSASRSPFTELELLSMSWDVFMLSVENFSPECDYIQLLSNASHTIMNRILSQVKKKNVNEKNIGEGEYPEVNNASSILIRDSLIALKDFRDVLPKKYKIVLDDCLASLGNDARGHQSRIGKTKLSVQRYYEAKKLMRWFTLYLLDRKRK